jgi:hypothetical protein
MHLTERGSHSVEGRERVGRRGGSDIVCVSVVRIPAQLTDRFGRKHRILFSFFIHMVLD